MSSSGCPVLSEGLSHPTMTSSLLRTENNPRIPKDPRGPQSFDILRMSPAVLNCMSSGSWTQNPQMNLRSQITKVPATIRTNNTDVTPPVQLLNQDAPAGMYLSSESSRYQISNLISDINSTAARYLSSESSRYQISNLISDINLNPSLVSLGVGR